MPEQLSRGAFTRLILKVIPLTDFNGLGQLCNSENKVKVKKCKRSRYLTREPAKCYGRFRLLKNRIYRDFLLENGAGSRS